MSHLNQIKHLFSGIILLLTLISFSGFIDYNSYVKPEIELLHTDHKTYAKTALFTQTNEFKHCVQINKYIVFNFKWLLFNHGFDYSITFKSQEKGSLQFLNPNTLERNLIALTHRYDYQDFIIE